MACGAFYLPQYFEGIEKVFTQKENIDWFHNVDELKGKIRYYLANENHRKEIARKGQEFILKHFDCQPLVSNLLNIIETGESKYEWDDVYRN
jgi:spore maturation protein CgeB